MRVGVTPGIDIWTRPWDERRKVVELVADAGIDHVFFADHVSFRIGHGHDGMVVAAGVANLHPTLGIYIGVYLLPLRHPIPVARQLANLAEMAPGRISFGVGVGGDDRHEVEICGVDPRTRGRRTDESLDIVQRLLAGQTVDHDGEFFNFEQARIIPTPDPPIPVYVGGRADAALRRAGKYADGWLGIWCSSDRYAESIAIYDQAAEEAERDVQADHGIQLWVGVGKDRTEAASFVGPAMEGFYRVPFEKFSRYTPHGTVDDIVDFLAPYLEAGCRHFNLTPVASTAEAGIEVIGEVGERLRGMTD
ncbi:MAG: LLM class flavin-dependent oxidoreductase [Acidimicrobiales bacterium]|nr:LLM class flavin-dependent oxidoreductase [Acidimicrobiales bacterium]MDP6902402.1 LLM class flavin-dependent oxidoreductase [Acidimicrobiales bacterium]HJL98089.1 LLM class flavin-dependent oxidoreductase [Acidimicrobiales bacterium]